MSRKKKLSFSFNIEVVMEFLKKIAIDKPVYLVFVPLISVIWAFEKWVFSISTWVPLAIAVWATLQYESYQRKILAEDLNRKWKRAMLDISPTTALEHCEWLNRLLLEVWPSYIHPRISSRFSYIVERRLKYKKPKLVESFKLEEFSLGSSPPKVGLQGMRWSTVRDQRIMHTSFDWDTKDMNIMLLAKLAKPLYGTARISINYLHIKGDVQLMPVLDGRAILLSFISVPEVRLGIALGSGGSQLPGMELPVVSSWLVKLLTDTLVKTMVEPRRRCLTLSAVQLGKRAVGGILYVTVVGASQLSRNVVKGSPTSTQVGSNHASEEHLNKDVKTFVEVEIEEITRRTDAKPGSSPQWDSTFNMVLHDNAGVLKFHLYECSPGSVKFDHLATCEIKVRYCEDDSTIFWAIGPDSGVIVKRVECCGKAVEINVPFEAVESGELMVRLVLKEWQFSGGSKSVGLHLNAQSTLSGLSNSKTGRKLYVTVKEATDIPGKDKLGRSEPYVRLQYGKVVQKTRAVKQTSNPVWNQTFEFDEITGGEYLKLKCLYEETFGDEVIGSATVNMEGLEAGLIRDVPVPLENANSGEVRLQIEAVSEVSNGGPGNGLIELVLIEARDLVAADLRGTSDPYVKVQYGNETRRTKVVYKTVNPSWNQTFEFPDDGSMLELQVKDHNAILSSSSIGNCIVQYQRLPPNEVSEKWIPLQGVKKGEIHVQITRKVPDLQKITSVDSDFLSNRAHAISDQMKNMLIELESSVEDKDAEEILSTLSELQSLEDSQEQYMLQLETERMLLLNKIGDLGQELLNSSPNLSRRISY
ncbi:synaptotagmin-5-like isoform X2 [Chenopodium quinoa]|uniref:synaptotagmin-5-like isoform X2 n=1 Tax=Chenopodium quinoa TaxID=63459 RepID=UPI000B7955B7|nr:synaptotagmin-5-like isoform X2 [Chenopodium quinoa]